MSDKKYIYTGSGLTLTKYGAGFRVIRRGQFNILNHLEGQENIDPPPSELVVEMVLPGVKDPNSIGLEVTSKEVQVQYIPGHPETDFKISLPFKVNTKADLQAKWIKGDPANLLQLTLPVIPEIQKYDPQPVFSVTPIDDPPQLQNIPSKPNQEPESQPKNVPPKDPITIHPQITIDEKVVTVVLYQPNLNPETLKIENQKFSIFDKTGQEFLGEFQTPFELHSSPKIQANSGFIRLFFVESEDSIHKEEESKPELPIIEGLLTIDQLENPFVFELEP